MTCGVSDCFGLARTPPGQAGPARTVRPMNAQNSRDAWLLAGIGLLSGKYSTGWEVVVVLVFVLLVTVRPSLRQAAAELRDLITKS